MLRLKRDLLSYQLRQTKERFWYLRHPPRFHNETEAVIGLTEILTRHEAFVAGSVALNLHCRTHNLPNARQPHDLDIICPHSNYLALIEYTANLMKISSPKHPYEDNNRLAIGIGPKQFLVFHLLAYQSDSQHTHHFPYQFSTTTAPLSQTISLDGVNIPVATTSLLVAMKTRALECSLIFPSERLKHQNDLDTLRSLLTFN